MANFTTQVSSTVGQPASVRVGTVISIEPVVIQAQGTEFTDVGFIDSYRPQVGDAVALLGQSSASGSDPTSWLAIGSLRSVPNGHQAGEVLVTFVTLTSFTQVINFPEPFADVPNVHVNINSGAGATSQWHARAITITPIDFILFVFTAGAASSWTDIPVGWSAFARTT